MESQGKEVLHLHLGLPIVTGFWLSFGYTMPSGNSYTMFWTLFPCFFLSLRLERSILNYPQPVSRLPAGDTVGQARAKTREEEKRTYWLV